MPGWSSAHTASLLAVSSVSFLALATLLRRRGEAEKGMRWLAMIYAAQPKMQTESHISIYSLCQLASMHKQKAFRHRFHVSLHFNNSQIQDFQHDCKAREALLAKSSYAAEVRVAVRLALQCGKAMRDPRGENSGCAGYKMMVKITFSQILVG